MLRIKDYSSWSKVYKNDVDSALRLIEPANASTESDEIEKIIYRLPFRLATELLFLSTVGKDIAPERNLSEGDLSIIFNARSMLHERVSMATVGADSYDSMDKDRTDFGKFVQMMVENPLISLLQAVGEARIIVSTYHGFTYLELEKVGKSVRAKVSHHQNDPTYVYGMPEILTKYAWDSSLNLSEFNDDDVNGFQAIYDIPKLDFEDSSHAIVSTFCEAISNSIHNLGNFDKADGRLVRLHLTAHCSEFDSYLSEHNNFVQKFWMHHYLHVRLNERYE